MRGGLCSEMQRPGALFMRIDRLERLSRVSGLRSRLTVAVFREPLWVRDLMVSCAVKAVGFVGKTQWTDPRTDLFRQSDRDDGQSVRGQSRSV